MKLSPFLCIKTFPPLGWVITLLFSRLSATTMEMAKEERAGFDRNMTKAPVHSTVMVSFMGCQHMVSTEPLLRMKAVAPKSNLK